MHLSGRISGAATLATVVPLLALLSSSAVGVAPSARAPQPRTQATAGEPTAPVEWSARHGAASASGTRWQLRSAGSPDELVIEGRLTNTGRGCSSLWLTWTHDFAGEPPRKHATQCGPGTVRVRHHLRGYRVTTTGAAHLCTGGSNPREPQGCGPGVSMTTWPVDGVRPGGTAGRSAGRG
ncbi:hypothetical protein QOM21_04490 [Streptomyces sp. Pv4-95]|uniref:hypothetical protein n=1 Tax=Streptomyces sp. Pv4-95 TaxID=3049543 RepID=UPI00389143B9